MQIIGQKSNIDMINKWNTLPNFVIIQGAEHTGKTFFTLYLCQHFNLKYNLIKNSVSNVRQLLKFMVPYSNTVYHFKNFETASLAAKNALLKITEEPIPGNYIIITGGPQIKTLESRARRILMEPFSFEENSIYMKPYFPDEVMQKNLIVAGINTPAKIYYYRKYELLQKLLSFAYNIFQKITYLSSDDIIAMLASFEDRYDKIDSVLLFLNMLINIINYNIKEKGYYSYKDILTILLEGKKDLLREPTLKRKMLLYKIFYQIRKLRRIRNMKNLKDLKDDIIAKKFNNFYVFYGTDYGLRHHYIKELSKHFGPIKLIDNVSMLADTNKSKSLFDDSCINLIFGDEEFANKKFDYIDLFIKRSQLECTIVTYDKELPSSTLFKQFGDYITNFSEVNNDIALEFIDDNINLSLPNKEEFAFNCHNNYNKILLESNKIKNYAAVKGVSDEVAYQDLMNANQLLNEPESFNIDALMYDVLACNFKNLGYWFQLIDKYYKENFWIMLTSVFQSYLIAYLLKCYGKWEGGNRAYDYGLPWGKIKLFRDINISYDADYLLETAYEVAELDAKIKSGKILPENLFEYFICTII